MTILESSNLVLPELLLGVGILGLVVVAAFSKDSENPKLAYYYSLGLILFYVFGLNSFFNDTILLLKKPTAFNNSLKIDQVSFVFKELIALATFVFLVHARLFNYKFKAEVYILIFFVLFGLVFLSMATHFLVIFISIEIVSISSYLLVASQKTARNFEAGIKYLIFGATASAVMLYGISMFYGITHSLNFIDKTFLHAIKSNSPGVISIIWFMVMGGLLFKAAAAPFHNWVPDVYEATPTPILSYLSYAPKIAAFLVLARFINASQVDLSLIIMVVAVCSLVIGNFSALWQTDLKRLLGYSGIAQVGFMSLGLLKFQLNGFYGLFFYAMAYLPITMGSFFLVDALYLKVKSHQLEDFKGLGRNNIIVGINALIIMVALIGLPPTVGFTAKLMIFSSLISNPGLQNNLYLLLVIFGLLNAAVSMYYYLKLPYFMLIKKPKTTENQSYNYLILAVLSYFGLSILYLFFFPDTLSKAINFMHF